MKSQETMSWHRFVEEEHLVLEEGKQSFDHWQRYPVLAYKQSMLNLLLTHLISGPLHIYFIFSYSQKISSTFNK